MKWIVQYRCGCSVGPLPKREILECCGKHGDDIQVRYPIPEKVKVETERMTDRGQPKVSDD